jgi:hypothetical protein
MAVITAAVITAAVITAAVITAAPLAAASPAPEPPLPAPDPKPFAIHVVDAETGRGVPLIELRTTNDIRLVTDSNGIAAFSEPGLLGQTVFFHVAGHGYELAADGFGFRGRALETAAGGRARLAVRRLNVAERLYRVTGAGIYRDSILVGEPVPLREPILNAQVTGSDSVLNAVYKGKIYWFWGDTNRPRYPLGNFHTPGATSELPGAGGLDPDRGIDLTYFAGDDGFARPTAKLPGEGPTWLGGLIVLRGADGGERMFAHYAKVRTTAGGGFDLYERGLVEFDDRTARFEKVATFPEAEPFPGGAHPFLHASGGKEHVYYCDPFPLIRVPADPESLARQERYEAYTPLAAGSRSEDGPIERDPAGRPVYAWKAATAPLRPPRQAELVRAGTIAAEDDVLALRDADTGKRLIAHRGSVYWNAHRRRWVMIACETLGTSMLGEIWYAEADRPLGPWLYARKIVTHERYSFYNPKEHPMLQKDGGRVIYFEGTYTATFSGNRDTTPRYDYNQILYRLDLSHPRLNLPVAVYGTGAAPESLRRGPPPAGEAARGEGGATRVAFWALERPGAGTVPIHAARTETRHAALQAGEPAGPRAEASPALFHAFPASAAEAPAAAVPLWELRHADGRRAYTVDREPAELPGFERAAEPFARVWPQPLRPGLFASE